MSIFTYCLPNLINITCPQWNKLNVLWNKCTHKILGISSYKLTTTNILKQIDWLSFPQTLQYESLKLYHKISFEMSPPAIYNYLKHSMVRSDIARLVRKPSVKHFPKTAKTRNSSLHRTNFIYNLLPDDLRVLNKIKFACDL